MKRLLRKLIHSVLYSEKSNKNNDFIDTNYIKSLINLKKDFNKGKDDRIYVRGINTVLETTLDEIIDKKRFNNKRVLEIGPKHGYHSKWIDYNLNPSKLIMLELPQKEKFVKEWISNLKCSYEIFYESLISSERLLKVEKFDLIFFTGVLYHTVEHFKILNILRRVIKDKGLMLFQTSIDLNHKEPVIFLNWKEKGQLGSYAYPSRSALLKMLAMTGWTNVTHYTKYRPKSNTILLTCQKSKDLPIAYDKLPFGDSRI